MGFFIGKISAVTRLKIDGDSLLFPFEKFDDLIKERAFRNLFLENSTINAGFVSINDCLDADFEMEKTLLGDYRVFSLRIDRRVIPPSTLKIRILEEEKKRLKETGKQKLFKSERNIIKEAVQTELIKNAQPVTAVYDAAIDMTSGIVYFSSLSNDIIQTFMDIFKAAFGVSLLLINPVREELEKRGATLPELDISREFLTWLWFWSSSRQNEGRFTIVDYVYKVGFVRRMLFESAGHSEFTETVTVCSGVNFDFGEAKEAFRQGKKVKEARLSIEEEGKETAWEFGFKGDSFQFQSVALPSNFFMDEDETPEGRNLDRLALMARIINIMDDLFKMFMDLRVSKDWEREISTMLAWATEEE